MTALALDSAPAPGASSAVMELPVLHLGAGVLAVAKPSGLLVHNSRFAGARERTAVDLVRERHGPSYAPVHRLDRGTSGVLLFADAPERVRAWQGALASAAGRKLYLALVRGRVEAPLDIDHPVPDEDGVRREARSRVEPVWSLAEPRCSLVRVEAFTGRFHQVRRHCHHASHPVLGDSNYGKGALNREYRARFGLARLALHAERVVAPDPFDGATLDVTAPLPDDLAGPIARILAAAAGG